MGGEMSLPAFGRHLPLDVGAFFFLTLAHIPPLGEWAKRSACATAETEVFFPGYSNGRPDRTEEAKAFCAECPVQSECRQYALRYPSLRGIWGGLTEKERKNHRRRLRIVS